MARDSLQDRNQVFTQLFTAGTLGTADVKGTAGVVAGGADPTTGAQYVYNLGPAGNVSVAGTDPTSYLPARLTDGTSFYEAGAGAGGGTTVTVDHGSIVITGIPNTPGGTIGLVTRVSTVGTLEVGTISTLPNTPGGTLGLVTTVSNLTNGSVVMTVGTVTVLPNTPGGTLGLVTTVSNLTSGSVRMTVGTLTVMPNVPGGTLGLVTDVTNLASGSVRMTVGTVTVLPNLPGGSIAVTAGTVSAGTINVGTITAGTFVANGGTQGKFDPKPQRNILTFATTSAGTIGTLVAAPSAGSSIWLTSLDISQVSGTAESVVAFGVLAQGAGVVARGNFVAGGGIAKSYVPASNANNTGTALTWNMLGGSGTVSYTGHYFIDVP